MINIIGWSLCIIGLIVDYFIIKSAVKSYREMKEAKRKAMMWDARIK